ncbi:MAG: type IV secretion system DNA-binding domain-containing protein [Candidatus Yanofskybacteria bacterium]|nr:type IV secretion system DNA-binding domain-containing protein [Candidatus Yanofskybacteria bacterium]
MDDRRRHMYVIGKTGMGKSELLKNIAIQDIQDGRGLAFVDPHGDPVEDLFDYIPEDRIKDVIYINPADLEYPIAFNVMEQVDPDKRHLVADGVMGVFKKIWVDVWSPRMEYILNNTILALLETPDATLLGINRMLAEKGYRTKVVSQLTDPVVKAFWTEEFAKYADRFASEATAAIQNKVGQFVSSTLIRNIIGQPKSTLDMRKIMDEGKILLVNISKGRIGEDASRLLGALIITKIQLAAMSRVDMPERERKDFILVVDEFQNFATASFANILSEARKYHLSLMIAHQYVAQMDEGVRDAVFGNVGTIVSFRVGAEDAELLEKELAPEFMATDIVNLGKRQIYLKLMIDGVASRAFSAMTMETIKRLPVSNRQRIIEYSREHYSARREDVEKKITEWHTPVTADVGRFDDERQPRSGGFGSGRRDYGEMRSPRSNYGGSTPNETARAHSVPLSRTGSSRFDSPSPMRVEPKPQVFPRNPMPSVAPIVPRSVPSKPVISANPVTHTNVRYGAKPSIKPTSFSEALKHGPVDFKGRKIEPKPPKPKVNVDVGGLRKILEESLGTDEK